MSFSDVQKNEIITQQYKSICCRRALLSGVLFSRGTFESSGIVISMQNDSHRKYISELIREIYGKEPEIKSPKGGGRKKLICFTSPAAFKYLSKIASDSGEIFQEKCSFCRSAFLRGVFLASGTVSDPEKQYRLELMPTSGVKALSELLCDDGISLTERVSADKKSLYTNKSSVIEDFFAALGLNNTVFTLMNKKIEFELKNNVNRIRNCETNNIEKSVSASIKQVEAIEALVNANMLSTLPEELEKTARLRLQFRDYSLSRLAAEFSPPISKPGLSHRLNKIVEISERLLGNSEE